jgi:hypothetical protein
MDRPIGLHMKSCELEEGEAAVAVAEGIPPLFFGLNGELYSNISARWTVSHKAAEQKTRSLVHPSLDHIQSARTLCTNMRRIVGCPKYMLNIKRNKRQS